MTHNPYSEMEITTARPESLVVSLYAAALRMCRSANACLEDGRVRERGAAISRALAIVGELQQSLDHERGGEISRNLDALYSFARERLLEAHLEQRREPLEAVERVLGELHSAWVEIARRPPESAEASR